MEPLYIMPMATATYFCFIYETNQIYWCIWRIQREGWHVFKQQIKCYFIEVESNMTFIPSVNSFLKVYVIWPELFCQLASDCINRCQNSWCMIIDRVVFKGQKSSFCLEKVFFWQSKPLKNSFWEEFVYNFLF